MHLAYRSREARVGEAAQEPRWCQHCRRGVGSESTTILSGKVVGAVVASRRRSRYYTSDDVDPTVCRLASQRGLNHGIEAAQYAAVRRYADGMPEHSWGWLAGLRDRFVGRVLALMHEQPAHGWTLDTLAQPLVQMR